MSKQELFYRLLARALLDIRIAAHESNHARAFHLADLFHNTPLRLIGDANTEAHFTEIIDWLEARSAEKKIEGWFDHAINECGEQAKQA
jgi:hypothetical protein